MKKNGRGDMMKTPGFRTPMSVPSNQQDTFKPPMPPVPGGRIPDPLGINPRQGGLKQGMK